MDAQHIYMERIKKHLIVFKDTHDDDHEFSILSEGDTELEAWKKAFLKLEKSYCKIQDLLIETCETLVGDTYSNKIYSCFVDSEYIETNPENPRHTGDTRTNTRNDAVFHHTESNKWGFLSR